MLVGQHKGPEVDGRGDTDSEKLSCDPHTCSGMHTASLPLKHKWGEKQNQINKHDTERQDPNSNQKLQQKTKTRRQTQNETQHHQQKGLKSQIRFREHCHGVNLWKKSDKAAVTRCAGNHELAIMTRMQLSTQTFLVNCQF